MKLYITSVLFAIAINVNAQTLQREAISSSGSSASDNGMLIRQTIGQPYGTSSNYSDEIRFNPGFQQPVFTVETIHSSIHLSVFPNPATQQVTIKTDNVLDEVRLQIINISGELLIDERLKEFSVYTANCDAWANGEYLITLHSSGNNLYTSKLIINK